MFSTTIFCLRIDTGGWALFHNSAYISWTLHGIPVNHISNERSHIQTTGKVNFKLIFQLLFFEHEYLAKYCTCIHQIFNIHRKHPYAGNSVSEFLFRA